MSREASSAPGLQLDPSFTQTAITNLQAKQRFYTDPERKLDWSKVKSVDGLDLFVAKLPLNASLASSLNASHECVVVRVVGHLPQAMVQCAADLRSDRFLLASDPKFKLSHTSGVAIVGKRPAECVWLREICIKSPLPLLKDQQLITFCYQNMVPPRVPPYNPAANKTCELLSNSLSPEQLARMAGASSGMAYQPSAYSQAHEVFTQVRLTSVHDAPAGAPANSSITHVEHFGVYCSPGTPMMIYKELLATTVLRKYTNFIRTYVK